MVLKKSNSGLNSGATQKVKRGCFVDPQSRSRNGLLYGTVDVDVQFPSFEISREVSSSVRDIREYLEFSAPILPCSPDGLNQQKIHFFNRDLVYPYQKKSSFSLGKGGDWKLGERLKALMKDIDFLKKVSQHVDIHFTENTENLVSSRLRRTPKTLTSAQVLKSADAEEQRMVRVQSEAKSSKSRKRQTYHGRGVQRRRIPEPREDNAENENQTVQNLPDRKPILTFTLNNPMLVDARASKVCNNYYDFSCNKPHGNKSFNKCKGYRNGLRAPTRARSFAVNEDMEDIKLSTMRPERCQRLLVVKDCTEEETTEPGYTLDLMDLIVKEKATKRKQDYKNKAKDLQCDPNSKSCDKPRHDKGSFTYAYYNSFPPFLTESFEAIDCSSVSPLKLVEPHGNLSKKNDVNLDKDKPADVKETEHMLLALNAQNESIEQDITQKQEKEFELFRESFVRVQTATAGRAISDILDKCKRLQQKDSSCVTVGDSFPLCFCVSPKNSRSKSYIVAKQTNFQNKSWLLSLQGASESEIESFRSHMAKLCQLEDHPSLDQLIKAEQEVMDKSADCWDLKTESNCISPASNNNAKPQTWDALVRKIRQKVSIQTAEEAAERLRVSLKNSKEVTVAHNDICISKNENIECGVCFSPCSVYAEVEDESAMMLALCGHAHCINCWKTHVYHSICNGAPKIVCMTSDCDTVMDETTLKSLVPASVITVWQARLRDKFLETSEFVSWCPNSRCGQLAVSNSAPLKKQFGSPLTCTCQRSWCSNCHDVPHWPVSCDQMKAYKKLLNKTGNKAEVPTMHAFYLVDMKKCPNCKYPIEKYLGCPSMVCRMCWFNFCWNCLKSTATHNVYSCTMPPSSKLITYQLTNKLVYDLPINFFLESLQANRDHALQSKNSSWLAKVRLNSELKALRLRHHQHSLRASCENSSRSGDKILLDLADDALAFIKSAIAQIELFYVIMGFVHRPNTTKKNRLTTAVNTKISRLRFVIDRLDSHIVGKTLTYIGARSKQIQLLLHTGASTVQEMFSLVPMLQQASKDVDTSWVESVDPSKHLRYM